MRAGVACGCGCGVWRVRVGACGARVCGYAGVVRGVWVWVRVWILFSFFVSCFEMF